MKTEGDDADGEEDVLARAFGGNVPPREQELWERLTPPQRERASRRLAALAAWAGGKGELSPVAAAKIADVSLSRFYRLAAEWREGPTLAAIGTFATPLARRSKFDPEVINALQSQVAAVVSRNKDSSVNRLIDLLVAAAPLPPGKRLPGSTKLGEIVQTELRRVAAAHDAGNAVVFDLVAVSLTRADGRPHVLFACGDSGTNAILGVALGDVERSVAGYAASAADALRSIDDGAMALPWGRRFRRAELTAGLDVDACRDLVDRLGRGASAANFQLSTRSNRFGRYIKSLVGPRMGRLSLTPTRTAEGNAMAPDSTVWSDAEALAEMRLAAATHNASILASTEAAGDEAPPPALLVALREMRDA